MGNQLEPLKDKTMAQFNKDDIVKLRDMKVIQSYPNGDVLCEWTDVGGNNRNSQMCTFREGELVLEKSPVKSQISQTTAEINRRSHG
jgi:hypothetical protein